MGKKWGNRILISVIVPIYNVEEYLARCIESIINQSYKDLEIILVDDGSTDSSGEICDQYALKDNRIIVIHKENSGVSETRNVGLSHATGEYIGYVDSDDWIEPDMFEVMVTNCISTGMDVAACRYREVNPNYERDGSTDIIQSFSRDEALEYYLCDDPRVKIYNSVWGKLFRAELVKEYSFAVGQESEDIMYVTKVFCNMNGCVYIDRALYNYQTGRAGSIMGTYNEQRMFRDEIPFFKEQIAYIRMQGLEEHADKAAYHFYCRLLSYYLDSKKDATKRGAADKLSKLIKQEQSEINRVYRLGFVEKSDRVRMQVMLWSPGLYYVLAILYENVIVSIKRKIRRNS